MNKNTFYAALLLVFVTSGNLLSQKLNFSGTSEPALILNDRNNLSQTPENIQSAEELKIIEEMNTLKSDPKSSDGKKILELQKKLETINHRIITVSEENTSGKLFSDNVLQNHLQNQTDVITSSGIYASPSAYIKSIASQVEQSGPFAGTIWTAVSVGGGDVGVGASPDTLLLFKSVDNGLTYSLYSRIAANVGNKINYDDMDMEIIESGNSVKYIYLTVGYITDGFTGLHRTSFLVYDVVNNSVGNTSINFPGTNFAGNKYSRPRITSDNAKYPTQTYVSIVVTQDSSNGINDFHMIKICRIFNPYTVNPAVTYMPRSIYLPLPGFSDVFQADIAYYNSDGTAQGDSIILVLSGYPGLLNNIYLYKAYSNASVYPNFSKTLTQNAVNREYARIASNGGSNQKQMVIVFTEKYIYNNFNGCDLNIYTTSDANNWSIRQIAGGGGISQIKYPDIIGKRNSNGKFYITNKWDLPNNDMITSYVIDNLNYSGGIFNHNNTSNKSYSAPKPVFRYVNNDSCLTLWPTYSAVNSSIGCNSISMGVYFLIQGLYNPVTDSIGYDNSTVYLRNSIPPYNKIDSAIGYNFGPYSFHNAVPGQYYISMRSRNTIETWFRSPMSLDYMGSLSLDMYQYQWDAYGNNQILVDNSPESYAFYSGDVNQDGYIDLTDITLVFNDASSFVTGYVVTDLTGDNIVDLTDLTMTFNNSSGFVSVIKP